MLPQAHTQWLASERVSGTLFSRTRFQCFLATPPLLLFKKLMVSTPQLVHGLRTMSLAKAVPESIKDHECERFALQERPPVPYVPEKGPVQKTVSLLKSNQSLKTTIGADAELCLPIWHCRMPEAFLMHVSSALNAIEKWGTFKAYKEASETYVEQSEHAAFLQPQRVKVRKPKRRGLRRLLLRLLGRTALRKRMLLRRPRKPQLRSTLQPQIFVRSARPSMRKPPTQKRPPRSRRMPLQPRCFSFLQICYLLMQSTRGTR
jgi:hypothetical protein